MIDEKTLARRAISLQHSNSLQEILDFLTEAHAFLGFNNNHPIIQLMAHKLRNVAIPNPEVMSYLRCERVVTHLAGIEDEYVSIDTSTGNSTSKSTLRK